MAFGVTRVSLIIIPFLIMLMSGLFYTTDLNRGGQIKFQSDNVTVNQQTGNIDVAPIDFSSIIAITVIISVALAICLVMALQVFGSGISGSVIPIVFIVTVLTGVYTVLSGLSYPLFANIPIFGIPLFFVLIIMYIVGLTTLSSGGGGD